MTRLLHLNESPPKRLLTVAERVFCEDIGKARLPPPVPEYSFATDLFRKWQLDWAWVPWLVALEVEGGIWRKGGGAHSHPSGILRDIEKYNAATLLGWRILRVQPEGLNDPALITNLEKLLRMGGWTP